MEAIKVNNVEQVNSNLIQLYQKADAFSAYLNQINSNWDEIQWKNFLYQYIKLLGDQIVAMAGGRFDEEIAIAGRIEDLASMMGNYMANGVMGSIPAQQTI